MVRYRRNTWPQWDVIDLNSGGGDGDEFNAVPHSAPEENMSPQNPDESNFAFAPKTDTDDPADMRTSASKNDYADGPAFGPPTSHEATVLREQDPDSVKEIEAEVDMNVYATWVSNGIGLAALSMSAFLIYPESKKRPQLPISYGFAVISILVFLWATIVYFVHGKRHWTIWLLLGIVGLIVLAMIGLLVIL
jgi:hypothetical protein